MATYQIKKVDTDPFTGRPAAIAILTRSEGRGRRRRLVNGPVFKTTAQRDEWVRWAVKRYGIKGE